MHNNFALILTLTGGLTAALAFGYVTHRLGLSPIVGYLLAGIAVGPNTPGFVANHEMADQLAEVGVILLMFGVGLHFHFKELLAVRRIALTGAITQSLIATALGAVTLWAFGWGWAAGGVYGLAISVASTVVLTRVLVDNNDLHTPAGHIAVGWLVVEDLFTVVVLVLLPALFGDRDVGPGGLTLALGLAALKIGSLVALVFLLGSRVIPWLLKRVAATRSRELFTLAVLVVALGVAVGSATIFGVSMALGAFLAGMVVGRSDFGLRAASEALPIRDAFGVLFFVSVGLLFDPRYLLESPGLVAATFAIIVLAKPLAALSIVLALRYPPKVALSVAVALAQIGEFSFILAALGKNLHLLPEEAINALVAAAIASISLNPLAYRLVDPLESWAARHSGLWRWLVVRAQPQISPSSAPSLEGDPTIPSRHRAVIVGYGPVGQTLVRLLRDNAIEPTVIEMNLETVQRLREEGVLAFYGDANHRETLKSAGLDRANYLIMSASSIKDAGEVIRIARELNPAIRVLARTAYLRERVALRQAGADRVFSGEGEVALAMTESVLQALGAIPEQIDKERERVRSDLFGDPVPAQAIESGRGRTSTDSEALPVPERQNGLSGESTEPLGETPSHLAGRGATPPPSFDQ
jgi:monovalent cation:H+ antiporter-2, CPA2 family